ncbi:MULTISPECIES: ATP-binding protein [unclassified Microbacterium]|uniref:ATP-binding protein n=1 Tax=unclassified Microbacterium TaxID=2609290 RepID=UPI00214AF7C3|nr:MULTISPECIES: ATP-binding protein [unclassified Microbacterium]MCR2810291.1 ATP-binding protein [Microbacterium sp. zg.B185]WIM19882.1 ATP-binding protein [Microbacterium sp. zg-B185]
MSEPESARAVLADAWGHIPQTRETTAGLGSFTRLRIERIISIVVGLGSLVLGTQAFLAALGPSFQEKPEWHLPLVLMTFVPLAGMIVACLIGRGVRIAAGIYAVIYPVALLLWPLATTGGAADHVAQPWIWYLVNVATVASVLAFALPLQIVWTVGLPILFGIVRLIQGDFAQLYWFSVALDVSFALILGAMLLTLGWVFRSVAANVDETRARAVQSYAQAAAADAAEQERVAVAALMHDSVLAALIAAERAHTPRQKTLAVAMAREALTRLANTEQDSEEGSDEPRDAASIADDIERAALELGVSVRAERLITEHAPAMPGRAARALVLAATQAVANAAQHAAGSGLAVSVEGDDDPSRVVITVRDTGAGFDLERVPHDRLGIRASIFARVAAVGGTSTIDSDANGTTVRLEWREASS